MIVDPDEQVGAAEGAHDLGVGASKGDNSHGRAYPDMGLSSSSRFRMLFPLDGRVGPSEGSAMPGTVGAVRGLTG